MKYQHCLLHIFALLILVPDVFAQETDSGTHKPEYSLDIGVGGGLELIRTDITPMGLAGIRLKKKDEFYFSAGVSLNYFFSKDANGEYEDWLHNFIFLEFSDLSDEKADHLGLGLSYLIREEGDYFDGSTLKVYLLYTLRELRFRPEYIFTNDLKSSFPGISFSVFF